MSHPPIPPASGLRVRLMQPADLPAADRILRLSFGTELGLADPMTFRGDSGIVVNRYQMYPEASFVAEHEGQVAGFGIASHWGSVGVVGPICVLPTHWGNGIARALVTRVVGAIDAWGCGAAGLFTNPLSPRHMRLYQDFGFWPRGLVVVLARSAQSIEVPRAPWHWLGGGDRGSLLDEVRALSAQAFPGLDLSREIAGVLDHHHGDLVTCHEDGQLTGLAVCHFGAGSEGGSRNLFIKYAQVLAAPTLGDMSRSVPTLGNPTLESSVLGSATADRIRPYPATDQPALERLQDLVRACAERARAVHAERVVLGIDTSRHPAYRALIEMGFRSEFQGVRMHRPWIDLHDGPSQWVLDDWR